MDQRLMTLKAAAERIGVPEATLRYWRHIGQGPRGAKLGRRVMFRVEDVDAWIEQQFRAEAARTA